MLFLDYTLYIWYLFLIQVSSDHLREAVIKLRVCALASGSRGNSIYVESGRTRVLIDAGISMREIRSRLGLIGVGLDDIDAVIVSHEHIDHIRGVGPIGRACGIPVYMTAPTIREGNGLIGDGVDLREFEPGSGFEVGGLYVEPFSTSHDAADSVGFTIQAAGRKIGIATDLGYASHLVIERLKGCDMLLIESNHDPVMLKNGPYPWNVKQRVAGREGHLSNGDAARLVSSLLHPGLRHVLLGHLSQTNNMPELAFGGTWEIIDKKANGSVRLGVALQDELSEIVEL